MDRRERRARHAIAPPARGAGGCEGAYTVPSISRRALRLRTARSTCHRPWRDATTAPTASTPDAAPIRAGTPGNVRATSDTTVPGSAAASASAIDGAGERMVQPARRRDAGDDVDAAPLDVHAGAAAAGGRRRDEGGRRRPRGHRFVDFARESHRDLGQGRIASSRDSSFAFRSTASGSSPRAVANGPNAALGLPQPDQSISGRSIDTAPKRNSTSRSSRSDRAAITTLLVDDVAPPSPWVGRPCGSGLRTMRDRNASRRSGRCIRPAGRPAAAKNTPLLVPPRIHVARTARVAPSRSSRGQTLTGRSRAASPSRCRAATAPRRAPDPRGRTAAAGAASVSSGRRGRGSRWRADPARNG